jgi:hypothetical protein
MFDPNNEWDLRRLNDRIQQQEIQDRSDRDMQNYLLWIKGIDEQDRNAEECFKVHGRYPIGYSREESERQREQAYKTYLAPIEPTPDHPATMIIGLTGGAAFGAWALGYWDDIVNAAKAVGNGIVTGVQYGLVGAGSLAFAAGAYKLSNVFWGKVTGDESPIKSAMTTAALFATVAGGVYYANRPDPATAEMRSDYYKAATGGVTVLESKNGAWAGKHRVEGQNCILVLEGPKNSEFARVANSTDSKHDYPVDSLFWVRKTELRPAPECRAF